MNDTASSKSYLLIDAGNSAIKWACTRPNLTQETLRAALRSESSRDEIFLAAGTLTHTHLANATSNATTSIQLPASPHSSLSTEPNWNDLPKPHRVWISNVAGSALAQRITQWVDSYWPGVPQHYIRAQTQQCGVTNGYHDPQQLGSDRWASLIAAHAAYPDEALLIATLGTATTLEALDTNGQFMGGLIVPGVAMMLRALSQNTAQLPDLETLHAHQSFSTPTASSFFALDTCTALQEGSKRMQAGFIEQGWHNLHAYLSMAPSLQHPAALQPKTVLPPRCLLSGGTALEITSCLSFPYTYHPHLVLQGLAVMAYEAE